MAKLNRDEILRNMLQTLVDGWGSNAVQTALDALQTVHKTAKPRRPKASLEASGPSAIDLVAEVDMPRERKAIVNELAMRFDEGSAFPKLSDVRAFLLAHHRNGTDVKTRTVGFKRMLPVLAAMSPKGLEKLLARSHYSGPADLAPISDAIRGAGETMRGGPVGGRDAVVREELFTS